MPTNLPTSPEQQAPERPRQRRSHQPIAWADINFWLDTALLVVFAALCGCATVVRFVFPPGPVADGWRLWSADYDQWCSLQYGLLADYDQWCSLQYGLLAALALGILVHVMLHWSWVCNVAASRFGRGKTVRIDEGTQTIYGVALLIVLLNVIGLFVAVAALMIQRSP
jgi:hypothetical protein